MSKVKVSVLMPVYNGEKYLEEAINSILNQTFKDFEFIIVDDCSIDGTWEMLKKYSTLDKRIILRRNKENLRTTKALNVGLALAKGKYVARMDADDWSYPNRLEKQFKFMEKHPKVGVSGGTIEVCDRDLKVLNLRRYPQSDAAARKTIFIYSPFAHSVTIWRAKILGMIGSYNENIPLSQDYELYFRMGKVADFANIPDVLLKLRTHDNSSSIVRGKYQEQYALYSRIKAFLEYGYDMTTADKLYSFFQMLSIVIIPPKIKFWLFNWLRRVIY